MVRPTTFDEKIADEFIDRLSMGETQRSICSTEDMPTEQMIRKWRDGQSGAPNTWCGVYARARLEQADGFAADIVNIADLTDDRALVVAQAALEDLSDDATETEKRRAYFYAKKRSVEAAKLSIDARKWAAARMHPSKWGDKVTLEHTGDIDKPITIDFSAMSTEQLEKIALLEAQLALSSGKQDE